MMNFEIWLEKQLDLSIPMIPGTPRMLYLEPLSKRRYLKESDGLT